MRVPRPRAWMLLAPVLLGLLGAGEPVHRELRRRWVERFDRRADELWTCRSGPIVEAIEAARQGPWRCVLTRNPGSDLVTGQFPPSMLHPWYAEQAPDIPVGEDPWGRPFRVICGDPYYRVESSGPDGRMETGDDEVVICARPDASPVDPSATLGRLDHPRSLPHWLDVVAERRSDAPRCEEFRSSLSVFDPPGDAGPPVRLASYPLDAIRHERREQREKRQEREERVRREEPEVVADDAEGMSFGELVRMRLHQGEASEGAGAPPR